MKSDKKVIIDYECDQLKQDLEQAKQLLMDCRSVIDECTDVIIESLPNGQDHEAVTRAVELLAKLPSWSSWSKIKVE